MYAYRVRSVLDEKRGDDATLVRRFKLTRCSNMPQCMAVLPVYGSWICHTKVSRSLARNLPSSYGSVRKMFVRYTK